MMKNKMTRILAIVIVLSMIFTTVAFAAPKHKQFEHYNKKYELKEEDYQSALKALINKEIVKGYGNGDYGLSGNVKRGDVIVMIIRMLEEKLDLDDYDDLKDAFEDVYQNDYYYDSINKAKKLGIAKGDGKSFKPNKPVTVQEAIWLVARASDSLGLSIDEEDVIEALKKIYEDELNKFAKRRDIFWMIYYVLGVVDSYDEEDDNDSILTYKIGINDVLDFDGEVKDDIIDAFEDETDNDFDQIRFVLPDEKYGMLYFDYDTKNEAKVPDGKFSADHIGDITFVPERVGNINIKYTAYDDNGHGYSETITIIIKKDFKIPNLTKNMKLSDKEITIDFKTTLKDLIKNNTLFNDLEFVKFILPKSFNGELLINVGDGDKEVSTKEYKLSKIVDITYKPDNVGTVNIDYKVYDEDGNYYDGLIKIIVEKNTILELDKKMNENSLFKFEKGYFEAFLDRVKFILPDSDDGVLYEEIKHSDGVVDLIKLTNDNRTFNYNELGNIYYEPVQDTKGVVTIEYIGYDGNVEYKGKVNLTIKETYDLSTINWEMDEDDDNDFELDFVSKLNKIDNSLDYVKIVNPIKGSLSLEYKDKYIDINENTKYDLDYIKNMFYHPNCEGPIYIYYTAYDGNIAYDGAIRVYVVD